MKTLLLLCLVASSFALQTASNGLPSLQSSSFGNLFAEIRSQISSGGPLEAHFGLGPEAIIEQLQILWPDQQASTFHNLEVNQTIRISRTK